MRVVNDPVVDGIGDDPRVSESGSPHARRAVATGGRTRLEMRQGMAPAERHLISKCAASLTTRPLLVGTRVCRHDHGR